MTIAACVPHWRPILADLICVATGPTRPRLTPLKAWAKEMGIPYTSVRDAHLRGEIPIVKLGGGDRHRHWYVDRADGERWLMARKEMKP
jgi:hypothetical protein